MMSADMIASDPENGLLCDRATATFLKSLSLGAALTALPARPISWPARIADHAVRPGGHNDFASARHRRWRCR
jgi:hypothetical protein